MENIISINHTKKNTIEFDLTSEGLETKGMEVFLVIKAKDMDIRFKCKDKKNDKWEVEVPVLNHLLEKTAYNCQIEVVSDGYHFIPMKGSLNVVGSADVYTTAPKNKTLESDNEKAKADKEAAKEKDKKLKEEEWVRPGSYSSNPMSKSVAQLAEEAMAAHKAELESQSKKSNLIQAAAELIEESASPSDEKSKKLAAILESVGIKPTKKKDTPRFSLK